jgi:hypothetical protein
MNSLKPTKIITMAGVKIVLNIIGNTLRIKTCEQIDFKFNPTYNDEIYIISKFYNCD